MMKLMSLSSSETLIIEDSIHGMNSGKSAGAFVVGLSGSIPIENMPDPGLIINNLDELTNEILEGI